MRDLISHQVIPESVNPMSWLRSGMITMLETQTFSTECTVLVSLKVNWSMSAGSFHLSRAQSSKELG